MFWNEQNIFIGIDLMSLLQWLCDLSFILLDIDEEPETQVAGLSFI